MSNEDSNNNEHHPHKHLETTLVTRHACAIEHHRNKVLKLLVKVGRMAGMLSYEEEKAIDCALLAVASSKCAELNALTDDLYKKMYFEAEKKAADSERRVSIEEKIKIVGLEDAPEHIKQAAQRIVERITGRKSSETPEEDFFTKVDGEIK